MLCRNGQRIQRIVGKVHARQLSDTSRTDCAALALASSVTMMAKSMGLPSLHGCVAYSDSLLRSAESFMIAYRQEDGCLSATIKPFLAMAAASPPFAASLYSSAVIANMRSGRPRCDSAQVALKLLKVYTEVCRVAEGADYELWSRGHGAAMAAMDAAAPLAFEGVLRAHPETHLCPVVDGHAYYAREPKHMPSKDDLELAQFVKTICDTAAAPCGLTNPDVVAQCMMRARGYRMLCRRGVVQYDPLLNPY